MAIPSTPPIHLSNSTASYVVSWEVIRSSNSGDLTTLLGLANKSNGIGSQLTNFYGFNGLCTISMSLGSLGSDFSAAYYRSVTISDTNILGRTLGIQIRGYVSAFRNSTGSPAFGSVGGYLKQSSPSPWSIQVWKTGSSTGGVTSSNNYNINWSSGTANHVYYLRAQEPLPLETTKYASARLQIISFWGACYATSSGSPAAVTI